MQVQMQGQGQAVQVQVQVQQCKCTYCAPQVHKCGNAEVVQRCRGAGAQVQACRDGAEVLMPQRWCRGTK